MKTKKIVIAGASGFVGRELIEKLLTEFPEAHMVALSRSMKQSRDPRLIWRQCDLFSEESIHRALPDHIDLVYYLVHAMEATARLDQGSFADYDLIMADNFVRACAGRGVKQLIYLGGLIPDNSELSLHLRSRLEIEDVINDHQIPHTFFRAGLVLGVGGSSFEILLKLVKRLHVMICPAWTQTLTSPVDLTTVIAALVESTKSDRHLGRTYDLAGCRPLSYLEMMSLTASHLGLKRYFVKVPLFSLKLSRLWVSLITNTSKHLVYPLIESLQHPMVARESAYFFPTLACRDYQDLLNQVPMQLVRRASRKGMGSPRRTVRSLQRIMAGSLSAAAIAADYFKWLNHLTYGLIRSEEMDKVIKLKLLGQITLIELERISEPTHTDRVTFSIKKGVLVRPWKLARLEFRLLLRRKFVVVAIHDYAPALPWFVYRYTQALIHLAVMNAFKQKRERDFKFPMVFLI